MDDLQVIEDDDNLIPHSTTREIIPVSNPLPATIQAKYIPRVHDDIVGALALLGYNDEQIADKIGVTHKTFIEWVRDYSGVVQALAKNRTLADAQVASALYKSACGYETQETIQELGPDGMQVTRILTKQVAPNGRDARQWLSIRQPELWRESLQAEDLDGSLTKYFDTQQVKLSQGDK